MTDSELSQLAKELALPREKVSGALELLDGGNTVPFITRYRKDQTGGLDEEEIRRIRSAATRLRTLAERKEAIRKSIDSQGKLTPTLAKAIERAASSKQLEDLYLPYRPKKQSLATLARQRGLEPLAEEILAADPLSLDMESRTSDFVQASEQLADATEAFDGVRHLLAERFSEMAPVRSSLREILRKTGQLVSSRVEPAREAASETSLESTLASSKPTGGQDPPRLPAPQHGPQKRRQQERLAKSFQDYFDFRELVSRVPPHRILAINRGERAKVLRVRVEGDSEKMLAEAERLIIPADHPHRSFLSSCVRDALVRLLLPSLARELRRELNESAEAHAIQVFARNLRKLLLQRPVRGHRLLAIDPGFRSGCKFVVLDQFGHVLQQDLFYIVGNDGAVQSGREKLAEAIREHDVTLIAIGNGTACRETEDVVSQLITYELQDCQVAYVIVNEAGASVYSTSPLGREELPEFDPIQRSSISIGRRLLDPLSELVKIAPAHLGVGMYQHDVKAKRLRESLDEVVVSCVNFVGVDVNTASPALLSYVSGFNQLSARRLYEYRTEHGPFRSREELRKVPGIGEVTFVQAAGFLHISDGSNPLDATRIHPESYPIAEQLLDRLGSDVAEVAKLSVGGRSATTGLTNPAAASDQPTLACRATDIDLGALASEFGVGELLLRDLLAGLTRPGRDPRDDLPPPVFRTGVMKLDDLKPGMELSGTVLNVVDFGAFLDIGISDSALIHISQLSSEFVRDPHQVVSVGDQLTVWVLRVDRGRRRVSLTAIAPEQKSSRDRGDRADSAQSSQPHRHGPTKQLRGPNFRARKARPAPTPPSISPGMAEGTEPMRSFADLKQFYAQREQDEEESQDSR